MKRQIKRLLGLFELILTALIKPKDNIKFIFIIGLPRSGTTLAYQIISQMDNIRPLYNIENWYSQYPALTSAFTIFRLRKSDKTEFSSNYGRTMGYFGVSEGSHVLHKYRNSYAKITIDQLNTHFEKKVFLFTKYIVMKNVYFLNDLEVKERENTFFVFIDRTQSEIITSMCSAREKLGITEDEPWSYCPSAVRNAWKSYIYPQNVHKQISESQQELMELKNSISEAKKIEVSYDEFKNNHYALQKRINDALQL